MRQFVCSVLGVVLAAQVWARPIADRTVLITLTLTDGGGTGIAGVPISITTRVGSYFGVTAASGACELQVGIAPAESELIASVTAGNAPEDAVVAAIQRWNEVVHHYVLPKVVRIPVEPLATTVAVNQVLQPARDVRVKCVTPSGQAVLGSLAMEGNIIDDLGTGSEQSIGRGVPLDAITMYAMHFDGRVTAIPVPASSEDIDLGTIVVPPLVASGAVRLRFTNREGVDGRATEAKSHVVLVASDGATVLQYSVLNNVTMGWTSFEAPNVAPTGEYWICPTALYGGVTADLLLELVRSGRSLEGTGIPKLTVFEGALAEQTIDAGAAQRAIWAAAGFALDR